MSSEIFKGMSTQDLDTFGMVDFMVDESLPGSFCRVKGDHGTLSRRSQRLSRHSGSLADDAIRHCIASCSCTIYQPINVPVDEKWECYMDRQDPDARPLFPSKNYMVYLSFSKMDDSYHLTVIKHEKNQENKIFLTIPLQALTTGNLKYNIKRPSWHQVSVQENGRQKDFVIDLGNDPQGATFTEKVKDALDNLEHGGSVNSHHTGYAQVRNSQEVKNSMEEGLMPSGVNRALSARLAKTDHTEKLVDQLRAAILTGDAAHARQIAECLANERITLKIELDKEEHQRRLEESYLNVKVHVEDRETSGCDIKMKFKPSDTIRDLKNSMKLQYEFPVEVQRWIIGKKIPKDNETLHKCGIRGSGHTLYLYLTTARSVGLDQQQSMDTMPRGAVGGEGSGDYMTMGTLRESVRRPPELSHGLSRPPSRQMSTLSSSSGTTLSAVSENDQTSISPLRNSDFTPNLGQPQSRAKSQHRAQTNNPQEVQDNTVFATGQAIASSNLQGAAPVAQVSEETGEVGWVCPRCTFLNKPTRPGCEVCGGDRPPDYQAPIGYIMSKEELCWLADDEEQRQMLEEARGQSGGDAGNEELTEEQLDLILRFNDALIDLQQKKGGQRAEVALGQLGQNVINLQTNSAQAKTAREKSTPLPHGEDVPDSLSLEQDLCNHSDEDNTEA